MSQSPCNCNYLKTTVAKSTLYGTYKIASTKVVSKAPKTDGDILTNKVSKGKLRNELLMDIATYGAATYLWWYMKDYTALYSEMVKDLPLDVVGDVYKAGVISLVDFARGKGSINGFIHELLLVAATDVTYSALDAMQ
jgi:hypothetical protein